MQPCWQLLMHLRCGIATLCCSSQYQRVAQRRLIGYSKATQRFVFVMLLLVFSSSGEALLKVPDCKHTHAHTYTLGHTQPQKDILRHADTYTDTSTHIYQFNVDMYIILYRRRYTDMHIRRHTDTQTDTNKTDEQIHAQSQIHTDTHRHTDNRHTQTQTHRYTQTHRHTNTKTHRHTDTQTHRHTDTQTHRHTDTQTHGHTHTLKHKQT